MADARRRLLLFVGLVVLCVIGAGVAIVSATGKEDEVPAGASAARASLASAEAADRPVALFRRPQEDGELAVAPLDEPDAPPALSSMKCARVYFAGGRGLCMTRGTGFAAGYRGGRLRAGPEDHQQHRRRGHPEPRARLRRRPLRRRHALRHRPLLRGRGPVLHRDDADRHGERQGARQPRGVHRHPRRAPDHGDRRQLLGRHVRRRLATASTRRWPPAARPT